MKKIKGTTLSSAVYKQSTVESIEQCQHFPRPIKTSSSPPHATRPPWAVRSERFYCIRVLSPHEPARRTREDDIATCTSQHKAVFDAHRSELCGVVSRDSFLAPRSRLRRCGWVTPKTNSEPRRLCACHRQRAVLRDVHQAGGARGGFGKVGALLVLWLMHTLFLFVSPLSSCINSSICILLDTFLHNSTTLSRELSSVFLVLFCKKLLLCVLWPFLSEHHSRARSRVQLAAHVLSSLPLHHALLRGNFQTLQRANVVGFLSLKKKCYFLLLLLLLHRVLFLSRQTRVDPTHPSRSVAQTSAVTLHNTRLTCPRSSPDLPPHDHTTDSSRREVDSQDRVGGLGGDPVGAGQELVFSIRRVPRDVHFARRGRRRRRRRRETRKASSPISHNNTPLGLGLGLGRLIPHTPPSRAKQTDQDKEQGLHLQRLKDAPD